MSPQGRGISLLTKHLHFVQSCKISSGYSSTEQFREGSLGSGGQGEFSLENQFRGVHLDIACVLSSSITPPEQPPPPSSLRQTGGSWFPWEVGSCWKSWARLGSPWLQVSPALTILTLDSRCLPASSGRAELLPSPPTSRVEEFSGGPFV